MAVSLAPALALVFRLMRNPFRCDVVRAKRPLIIVRVGRLACGLLGWRRGSGNCSPRSLAGDGRDL